jgi:predicted nucleic acid-binding protein
MRVYLDTALIIYLVEAVDPFVTAVRARLSNPDTSQVCSDLSWLECRVKPMREGDKDLLADYDDYFGINASEVLSLTREVLDRATSLRARYGFTTPDAIHLAAAIMGQCDSFLTNDRRLKRCADIQVEVIAKE